MANSVTSIDTILGTQNEQDSPRTTLPWYGKILATGVLALAPLVGAYAEEPAKPEPAASCVTLTNQEEAYVKRFDDKVSAVKTDNLATTGSSLEAACDRAGRLAMNKKSYAEAAAYLKKSIQLNPDRSGPYEFMSVLHMKMASEERDPKAKTAYFKECVKYGEGALAVLDKKAATSGGDQNVTSRAKISADIGGVLYALNERRSALKYLEDAKRLNPAILDNVSQRYLADLQRNPPK